MEDRNDNIRGVRRRLALIWKDAMIWSVNKEFGFSTQSGININTSHRTDLTKKHKAMRSNHCPINAHFYLSFQVEP